LDNGIETVDLTKVIDKKTVLSRLNLSVPEGVIHGLIGSNGAGKTTTLKILSGLTPPTSGIARINNYDVNRTPELAKQYIGYVPENPRLYGALTVRETLEFVASLNSVPKNVAEPQIERYMRMFSLHRLEEEYTRNLSRGEAQRVLLSSILVHGPPVLLLDEPFFTLDPHTQKVFRELLKEKRENGASILIATHLLELAERICDSITLLSNGNTLIAGSIYEVKESYGDIPLEEIYIKLTEHEVSG
jgi:ABC-2 type transport system ATP-binding protein